MALDLKKEEWNRKDGIGWNRKDGMNSKGGLEGLISEERKLEDCKLSMKR